MDDIVILLVEGTIVCGFSLLTKEVVGNLVFNLRRRRRPRDVHMAANHAHVAWFMLMFDSRALLVVAIRPVSLSCSLRKLLGADMATTNSFQSAAVPR